MGPTVPILAAGGISDARAALAALSLGAEGVVMGSRFATAWESTMAAKAKALILDTRDGGRTTMRYPPCCVSFQTPRSRAHILMR